MTELQKIVCLRCGSCCKVSGYVRISEKENDAIASYLGMDVREFNEKFTRFTSDRPGLSLIEKDDGSCIFLSDDLSCRINSVKPAQCSKFPFTWRFKGWEDICEGAKQLKSRIIS